MQALAVKGAPMPAGAVLYSPWTDLTASGASVARNAESDCMFREETVRSGGRRYAGTLDLEDPRVSPLFGDLRGLPPLLVFASSSEMLFDDSARLVERARAGNERALRAARRPRACMAAACRADAGREGSDRPDGGVHPRAPEGRAATERRMRPEVVKLLIAVVLDILDFTLGRIPGFEVAVDIILGVAAVAMWGWAGFSPSGRSPTRPARSMASFPQ